MRRIILASQSKARQKLLRQLGLRFQSVKSHIKERRQFSARTKSSPPPQASCIKGLRSREDDCADLVIENAFNKAYDIARRFDSGIVIAADTVVLVGKKIIGKPKDTRDALRTLKSISKKPQWVYTGLAVMDINNRVTLTDYEKTKIYMYPLSIKQIRNYFKKVSPQDMAGSFDIQGRGSIFIKRIEGCFYNVVGLPLAKLARMLERVGMDVF